jgi:hypothetical protein
LSLVGVNGNDGVHSQETQVRLRPRFTAPSIILA